MPKFRWWLLWFGTVAAIALVTGCSDGDGQVPCEQDQDCADDEACIEGFCRADENQDFNVAEPPDEREARLFVDSSVDFFFSEPGTSQWLPLEIHNGGKARLDIDAITLSDDQVFDVTYPEGRDEDGRFPEPGDDADSFSPTSIEPGGDPVLLRVWFHPEDEEPHLEELTIFTNDPSREEHAVELRANFASSCLALSYPDGIDFQSVPVGQTLTRQVQITNCSTITDLELFALTIADSGDGAFSIAPDSYPGNLPGETLTLSPLETRLFAVEFSPHDEGDHTGELLLTSTDENTPEMRLPLTGQGVDGQCPEARISASTEGDSPTLPDGDSLEVQPLDTVHLSAEESTSGELSYQWSLLEAPRHSAAKLGPSADIVDPDLWLDLAGRYVVELTVRNEEGIQNCTPATLEINAVPTHDVYVELEWWVTGIADPEGGEGVDLDLHYLHPNGNWGSTDWSVFSEAPEQSWDEGQAQLLIDDAWGEFPEVIVHDDPQPNTAYDVGVHYQWDLGFGTAFATVSVYLQGVLTARVDDQSIHDRNDLWHMGFIEWDETPGFEFVDEMVDDHSLTSDEPQW